MTDAFVADFCSSHAPVPCKMLLETLSQEVAPSAYFACLTLKQEWGDAGSLAMESTHDYAR